MSRSCRARRRPARRPATVPVVPPARAFILAGSALAVLGTLHQVVNLRGLRRPPADPPPVDEPVTLALPVRDEAHRVVPALAALLAQRGVPDLELLVLDDGSTDGTADVVRAAADGDPRLRVLPGTPPPPGLPGKPHACAQLAAAARGSVLVFVDADVVLAPHAVAAAVAVLRGAGLDLLSPVAAPARRRCRGRGWCSRCWQWSWMVSLPLRRAERSTNPALCAANGQFLVVDAAALARAGRVRRGRRRRARRPRGGPRGQAGRRAGRRGRRRRPRGLPDVRGLDGSERRVPEVAVGGVRACAGVRGGRARCWRSPTWCRRWPPCAGPGPGSSGTPPRWRAGCWPPGTAADAPGPTRWPTPLSVAALLGLLGASWRGHRRR